MSNDTPKLSFVITVKITDRRLKVIVESFFCMLFQIVFFFLLRSFLYCSHRCKLVELINLRFNLSRLVVKCRISESHQGLSFCLTTTRFEGIHSFLPYQGKCR